MESAYFLEPTGAGTGNVTFYPKANALVVGDDVWEDLDDGQRAILEKAAARTRERLIETTPSDAEAARAYCEDGGAVVLASDAQIAALEEATSRLYAELERDELTRKLIGAIRKLKQSTTVTVEIPKPCGDPGAAARWGDQQPGRRRRVPLRDHRRAPARGGSDRPAGRRREPRRSTP